MAKRKRSSKKSQSSSPQQAHYIAIVAIVAVVAVVILVMNSMKVSDDAIAGEARGFRSSIDTAGSSAKEIAGAKEKEEISSYRKAVQRARSETILKPMKDKEKIIECEKGAIIGIQGKRGSTIKELQLICEDDSQKFLTGGNQTLKLGGSPGSSYDYISKCPSGEYVKRVDVSFNTYGGSESYGFITNLRIWCDQPMDSIVTEVFDWSVMSDWSETSEYPMYCSIVNGESYVMNAITIGYRFDEKFVTGVSKVECIPPPKSPSPNSLVLMLSSSNKYDTLSEGCWDGNDCYISDAGSNDQDRDLEFVNGKDPHWRGCRLRLCDYDDTSANEHGTAYYNEGKTVPPVWKENNMKDYTYGPSSNDYYQCDVYRHLKYANYRVVDSTALCGKDHYWYKCTLNPEDQGDHIWADNQLYECTYDDAGFPFWEQLE